MLSTMIMMTFKYNMNYNFVQIQSHGTIAIISSLSPNCQNYNITVCGSYMVRNCFMLKVQ